MQYEALNLQQKPDLVSGLWSPRVIAERNDYLFELVRVEGEFVCHDRADTGETFIVIEASLRIELRDDESTLNAGGMHVMPAGVEHRPRADPVVKTLLIEACGVVNTDYAGAGLTASGVQRI